MFTKLCDGDGGAGPEPSPEPEGGWPSQEQIGTELYTSITAHPAAKPELAGQITGMLLDRFEMPVLVTLGADSTALTVQVDEALRALGELPAATCPQFPPAVIGNNNTRDLL